MTYDSLRRLSGKYVAGRRFEKMIYGESYTITDPKTRNLRGALLEHYDTSGKQALPEGYDFKGNPVATAQQLLLDKLLGEVDWDSAPPDLDPEIFYSNAILDALNRPVRSTDPGNHVQEYIYDQGGALKQVKLDEVNYVNDIHYDAKGQRQAIWYGNDSKTSYRYDPKTYRLTRLFTVNLKTGSPQYNKMLQDLYYYYDPVGNITRIRDEVQEYVFYNNTVISPHQVYTYDALYRLVIAEGREHISNTGFNNQDNNSDSGMIVSPAPLQWDINALQTYTQRFSYDAVGNILELKHSAAHGGYTRTYAYAGSNNRLTGTTVGSMNYTYNYDVRGNTVHMPHLSVMAWNSLNELYGIANSDMQTWYQYSGGQRVRKYVEKATGVEERIYLGNFEIYRKFETLGSLTPIVERTTVHISDDTGRIAMRERRTVGSATDDHDTDPLLTRYIYSNHLQSASLELDENAEVFSYEEYHPYGTTAYQASNSAIKAVAKRYRYTGKERDDESGLYYHGARYYIPWLCRWTSVDPLESKYGGMSPYNYSFNNPVMFNDPSGMDPKDGNKPLIAADATAMAPIVQTYNLYSTPDGGMLQLPVAAKVESTFSKAPAKSGDVPIHPLDGSVWTFNYKNDSYRAQFDDTGAFTYYESSSNSNHRLGFGINTTPKVDPNKGRDQQLSMAGTVLVGGTKSNPYVAAGAAVLSGALVLDAISKGPTLDLPIGVFKPARLAQDDANTKPVALPIDWVIPKARTKNNDSITLYRGVSENAEPRTMYSAAKRGYAVPTAFLKDKPGIEPTTNPNSHVLNSSYSVYSSWSILENVAMKFATDKGKSNGVILKIRVSKQELIESTFSEEYFPNDFEFLLYGVRKANNVINVTSKMYK